MYFEAASESLDRGIHVVSANRSVLRVLAITGLDEVFAIYPSRAAALNGDGDH